jgi:transposase
MTVQVADAHGHVQWLVSVVKTVTVVERYTTEEQRSVVRFLLAKGLNAEDIHKETFPVYGGKCLLCKVVHNWVKKFSQGHLKVTDDARSGRPVETATEATVQQVEELI